MRDEMKDRLTDAGIDVDGAVNRFSGMETLYFKFLNKFISDDNFDRIGPAVEAGNYDDALTAAHTLKGVAGNLGMNRLMDACAVMVDRIRKSEFSEAVDSYQGIKSAYEDVTSALHLLEEEH